MTNAAEASTKAAPPPTGLGKPTRTRYFTLSLVLVATVISYIDRVNISIVAPFMTRDLGIDKVSMGFIFSAFAWTYAFALIPGGYIADRFGSRIGYAASLAAWSIATMLQGLATSIYVMGQYIGLTMGITSLSANLAGIVTPIVIGYIVHTTGSFAWVMNFVGMLALIGTLSYSLLLGRLHRIVMDDDTASGRSVG